MKQRLLHFIALLLLLSLPAIAALEKVMSVQVREGQLRSTPSYLSRVVTTLKYTDRVTVLEERGDWLRVKPEGSSDEGWIHSSALTKKKLTANSGDVAAATTVSSEEQALAGKGFSSDVESKFKERNKDVDFKWIDKMEKITIPTTTITRFLKDGDIAPEEGGAK